MKVCFVAKMDFCDMTLSWDTGGTLRDR